MFRPTITDTMPVATAVVIPRLTRVPITSARRVSSTSGTRANGIPNESTTWDMTRLVVAGRRSPSTASAGSMVSAPPADEALHDDLAGVGPHAGGGQARREQSHGER